MKKYRLVFLSFFICAQFASAQPTRTITINYSQTVGPLNTQFNTCIGAGRANEGLRADWQEQLAMVKKECGFRYIRMHGLLTDDMGVYREDRNGKPEYNFQYIDVLYDYILRIGMKPFVELGFMPSALASGDKTIFWWKGNVTPPKDYKKWGELIRQLTLHFTERYGAAEVKTWYFEVWNEPNLTPWFWTGSQQEYFTLYEYSAAAIKSVNKDYRVGGPATAGAAWVPETIQYCADKKIPLDFISTHTYGVKQGFLDEYGNTGTILDKDPMSVSRDILNSRKQIAASAMPGLELHYTEWSASYTPADPIHDSYHEAAYILEKIRQSGTAPQSMSYWVFTDIFEEAGPRFTPFHGGFGLLNTQGIKKPAYFAYNWLNQLGETTLLNSDSSSIATRNKKGDIQLLCWDFTNTHPGDTVNNQSYYIRDLPAASKGKLKIMMSKLPAGNYQLEICQTGYKVNDAYSSYLALNRPAQLTAQQVNEIKTKNNGAPILKQKIKIGNDGVFSKELPLRENDVFLVSLKKL